jgi:hypothetical protein
LILVVWLYDGSYVKKVTINYLFYEYHWFSEG